MNRCLQEAGVPEKMTKGKTTLIQRYALKAIAFNYCRPITCLPIMWKILTTQIREEIYDEPKSHKLFSEEQKKVSRGTRELHYID